MKKLKMNKETIALSMILILSAILNFANLGIEGYANQYYAAGVKSMTLSLKNFFFVSFDPGSFVSIDKPPLGFWIQAISAKLFGFSGWSIILPQALAGVLSVALIHHIVKRSFGTGAGLISALCLAVTPVFVATSRNNTCDNLLVLTLLLACWALSIAAEKGSWKLLLASFVIVGVGFNIKMLQAYMIAPALYMTYLLSSSVPLKKRIIHLASSTVVLLAVSLSWALVVDMIPAASRPFVGSSTNNTVMELILGHNGLERLGIGGTSTPGGGNQGKGHGTQWRLDDGNGTHARPADGANGTSGPGAAQGHQHQGQPTQGQAPQSQQGQEQASQGTPGDMPQDSGQGMPDGQGQGMPGGNGQMPPMADGRGPAGNKQSTGGKGMGGTFGGQEKSSITRLFSNNSLSDQIVWFLPLAVFGFVAAAIKEKLKKPFVSKRKLDLIMWSMWLLPEFIYFSYTKGLFHPYYLTMLAAPIAALTGIGTVYMWQLNKEGGRKSWILPAALLADGGVQMLMLHYSWNTSVIAKILMALVAASCIVPSMALCIMNLKANKAEDSEGKSSKLRKMLISTALASLLAAPAVWSSTPMFYQMSGTFPSAGLGLMSSKGMGDMNMNTGNADSTTKLVQFLQKNRTNEKYLLAVPSSMSASDMIIKTGEPVMALGGFSGSDQILTLDQFKKLVSDGVVRYAIADGMGGPGGNNEITSWIKENGKAVSQSEWNGSDASSTKTADSNSKDQNSSNPQMQPGGGFGRKNSIQLYDLKDAVKTTTKK